MIISGLVLAVVFPLVLIVPIARSGKKAERVKRNEREQVLGNGTPEPRGTLRRPVGKRQNAFVSGGNF